MKFIKSLLIPIYGASIMLAMVFPMAMGAAGWVDWKLIIGLSSELIYCSLLRCYHHRISDWLFSE